MGAAVQGHLRDQCPATDGDRGVDRGLQHHAAAFGLRRDAPVAWELAFGAGQEAV
jgi:hypothetical protein